MNASKFAPAAFPRAAGPKYPNTTDAKVKKPTEATDERASCLLLRQLALVLTEKLSGRDLQPDWMSSFETARQALGGLPARRPAVAGVVPRCGIEPQPGNNRKSVAFAGIDGYPFAAAALTVDAEFGGAHR